MEDRIKNSILEAIKYQTTNILKEAFKTFTIRQGQGIFVLGKGGEDGNGFLFCRSLLCSWQRGCNENSNDILPKKTDISKVETEP